MHIGVNLLFLVPGQVGGSEPYLLGLVKAILDSEHEFTVFAPRGFARAFPDVAEKAHLIEAPWSGGMQGLRISAENSWLAVSAAKLRIDVLHHGGGTSPFVKVRPSVVTIHDIQYRHYPENFVRLKRAWLQVAVPHAGRRSEVVTVPSRFVKDDIVQAFGIDPQKVIVVPFGAEGLLPSGPSSDEVKKRYQLERPYFLYPSRTYPHKNHALLVEAFLPLANEADLVLTGARWFRDKEISTLVHRMNLGASVKMLWGLPRTELMGLFGGALALAYPSKFEGFGAPILEAMSNNCPVVASSATSIPEVVGEAGLLVDPDDPGEWTKAMQRILEAPELRADLTRKGRDRASQFTWERSASIQLAAYKKAVAGR